MSEHTRAFKRGMAWADRRKELKVQHRLTPQQLKRKETLLENALAARRTAKGPDDEHIKYLMTDWLLIHEELEGES